MLEKQNRVYVENTVHAFTFKFNPNIYEFDLDTEHLGKLINKHTSKLFIDSYKTEDKMQTNYMINSNT